MYVHALKPPSLLSNASVWCLGTLSEIWLRTSSLLATPVDQHFIGFFWHGRYFGDTELHPHYPPEVPFNDIVLESCKDQALIDVSHLEDRLRQRLEWSVIKLLRGLLIFLDTQTWRPVATDENELESAETSPGDKSLSEVSSAVELTATTFKEPLASVGVNLLVLHNQIIEVVEYAQSYLSMETEAYHKV